MKQTDNRNISQKDQIPGLCYKTHFIRGFRNGLYLTQHSIMYTKALTEWMDAVQYMNHIIHQYISW
jgi:hypothetical protein